MYANYWPDVAKMLTVSGLHSNLSRYSANEDIYIMHTLSSMNILHWARILVQVTIYRRLLIGRDGHLDQSEGYDIL